MIKERGRELKRGIVLVKYVFFWWLLLMFGVIVILFLVWRVGFIYVFF